MKARLRALEDEKERLLEMLPELALWDEPIPIVYRRRSLNEQLRYKYGYDPTDTNPIGRLRSLHLSPRHSS